MAAGRLSVSAPAALLLLCLWGRPADAAIVARRSSTTTPAPGNPADSQTIEGPDCGNVKKIFPQWEKAKKVGQVAGRGQGTIAASNAVAGGLRAASARVLEAANALGEPGTPHPAMKAAADKANLVADDVDANVTALEAKLGAFNTAVGASDMSGADVTDAQITEIEDLTSALQLAARSAQEEVKRLLQKAKEVQEEALKSSKTQARLVSSVLDSIEPLLKEAPDVSQKAGWSVNEAKDAVTAADTLAGKIDPTAAGNQSAVVEAEKNDLTTKKQAVADQHPKVTTAIGELDTAVTTLETKAKTLADTKQDLAGGAVVKQGDMTSQITAAEDAEADVRIALEKLRGAGKTLMARKGRLDAVAAELEKYDTVGPP